MPADSSTRTPLKSAYLILGDDHPKIETALKRLKGRIRELSGSDLNIEQFDATGDTALQAISAANTLAFFGGIRLVLVLQAHSWSRDEKTMVAQYLKSPAPDACLTLVAEKLPPGDVLRSAIQAHGEVLEYPAPKEGALPQWVLREAGRLKLRLGLTEARYLVQRCGENQSILLRELEKLEIYMDGGRAGVDDIRRLTLATTEAGIFDLLDSLAAGRGAAAFEAFEQLLAQGERHENLFYRILRHFQTLARVAAMREEGMSREEIQAELKLKPFTTRKMMEQVTGLGLAGIELRLAVLAECDGRMKGLGTLPGEMELQLCLGRLLSAA